MIRTLHQPDQGELVDLIKYHDDRLPHVTEEAVRDALDADLLQKVKAPLSWVAMAVRRVLSLAESGVPLSDIPRNIDVEKKFIEQARQASQLKDSIASGLNPSAVEFRARYEKSGFDDVAPLVRLYRQLEWLEANSNAAASTVRTWQKQPPRWRQRMRRQVEETRCVYLGLVYEEAFGVPVIVGPKTTYFERFHDRMLTLSLGLELLFDKVAILRAARRNDARDEIAPLFQLYVPTPVAWALQNLPKTS